MSVEAIDVVLADGTMVRAAEDEHADLFWAARGAGPGFFGVVTRFYVRLHDRPAVQLSSAYHFGPEHLDELMTWAHAVGPSVPDSIELMVFMRRDLMGVSGPGLQLLAPVLAASEDQAHEDAAFLNSCPILDRANAAEPMVPTDVRELVAHSSDFYPEGWRYAVDNTWTHATADELMPHYRHIVETLPDSPSHAMWMNWHPDSGPQRPDMAYSLEDDVYLGLYGVWRDERDDGRFRDWATTRMRALEPLSSGIQLADENLARRPARFVSDDNLRRLDEVRDRYDPDGVFHEWLARPTAR
jgi:FAD/FMN-containing dehydrogenase